MRVPYRDLAWEHGQLAADLTPVLARVAQSSRYLLGPELDGTPRPQIAPPNQGLADD